MREIGNLLYGQSGGPTSVINSSAYYLIKEAAKHNGIIENIYVTRHGIEGVLSDQLVKINPFDKDLEALLTTPGAAFGTNRFKIKENAEEIYSKVLEIFKKYNIRYFFYNGGNDSMDTICKLDKYFKSHEYPCYCIGIPKTIDNDLACTDHCLGFPTSAKFIINSISQVYFDDMSYQKGAVNIFEIMGRNAGWLTASSYLSILNNAPVDLIYVPERPFDMDEFLKDVKRIYEEKKHVFVAISEGIKDKDGNLLFRRNAVTDAFNHAQLGGVATLLSGIVHKELGYKVRGIEFSTLQRASTQYLSKVDIDEANKVSKFAVEMALDGESGKMVVIKRISSDPYRTKLELASLDEVGNEERVLPDSYINAKGNNIDPSYIDYVRPLIKGNINAFDDDGLIKFYHKL